MIFVINLPKSNDNIKIIRLVFSSSYSAMWREPLKPSDTFGEKKRWDWNFFLLLSFLTCGMVVEWRYGGSVVVW